MRTPYYTDDLKQLSKEITALPEPIQSKVLPCATKITELVTNAGDAGHYALALVFETVKSKVQLEP